MMSIAEDLTVPQDAVEDVLAMTEVEVPPEEPEAHRGTIVSVSKQVAGSGSTSFRVNLQSIDTGRDDVLDVWLPRAFVENIAVDPATLPDEQGNRQRMSFSIGIANSRKDATIQSLKALAEKAGRTFTGAKPTTIDEFIAAYNDLLSGLEIVYTRRPEKSKEGEDPRFAGRLRVGTIMSQDEAFSPRALKKYKKLWEGA